MGWKVTANRKLNYPLDYKSRPELIADNVRLAAIVNNAVVALRVVGNALAMLRGKWWWRIVPKAVRVQVDRAAKDVGERLDESGIVEASEDGEVEVKAASK